ncbi:type II toxin-antitoxin system HicB family antitoxin [soil metagenome]
MKTKTEKKIHLPILVEQDEDGIYIVSCPAFDGCHSYGKTIEEALSNIREVIDMCLDEIPSRVLNRFIGFRELEVKVA